jgi:hypothetical protein
MTQLTLTYPDTPGHKRRDTSKAAALSVEPGCATLRQRCLAIIERHASTADEVAASLNQSVLSIRPRIAELATVEIIVDSGIRRLNASGKSAIVWRCA